MDLHDEKQPESVVCLHKFKRVKYQAPLPEHSIAFLDSG
jgi:hypothetical protein